MTTAIDTNILVGLWNKDDSLNLSARDALEMAYGLGGLVICGAVYAEISAFPKRDERFLETFIEETGIVVDWAANEAIWRTAASAFKAYADRRRRRGSDSPRRILADFFIGAHALENGYRLLTLDDGIYRAAFPDLDILRA